MSTDRGSWERFRACHWSDEATGFALDASRMDLPDGWADEWTPRMAPAFEAMAALEKGAIANPDEKRMVGHYWLRAPDLAPDAELGRAILDAQGAIRDFAIAVHSGRIRPPRAARFTNVLSIGIGGSALGPQFVADALAPKAPPLAIRFLDNTDPDGIDRVIAAIGEELASTLVLVISKSGGTPEPRNGVAEVESAFGARGLTLPKQSVAITGAGSKLDKQAADERWLARFPMWDWVGGRTSELSAVGLLPAALQGIPVEELLEGAAAMDRLTRVPSLPENPAAIMAVCWHHATGGRGARDLVVLPYKDRLLLLSRYLQQLVMESLGKEHDLEGRVVNQGLAVYGNKGSTDQHAYVQQLRDGVPNFFVTFVEVLRDRQRAGDGEVEVEPGITSGDYLSGFLQGTRRALHEKGRTSLTLTVPEVSPAAIGGIIALFERTVGLYASLVGVNAYHQPGVEAGKKAAADVLALQLRVVQALKASKEALTTEQVAERAGAGDVEAVYLVLRHLAANRRELHAAGGGPFERTWRWK